MGKPFSKPGVPGIAAKVTFCDLQECARCWRRRKDVGSVAGFHDLCRRCAHVVERWAIARYDAAYKQYKEETASDPTATPWHELEKDRRGKLIHAKNGEYYRQACSG